MNSPSSFKDLSESDMQHSLHSGSFAVTSPVPSPVPMSTALISRASGVTPASLPSILYLNLHVRDRSFPKVNRIDALNSCTSLQVLNMSYNVITHIENIRCLSHSLLELNLAENRLESLGDEIFSLIALQRLNLSGNFIEHVPAKISSLQAMQSIRLSRNRLNTLVELQHLGSLSNLVKLRLEKNPFGSVTQLRSLAIVSIPSLISLDGQEVSSQEKEEAAKMLNVLRRTNPSPVSTSGQQEDEGENVDEQNKENRWTGEQQDSERRRRTIQSPSSSTSDKNSLETYSGVNYRSFKEPSFHTPVANSLFISSNPNSSFSAVAAPWSYRVGDGNAASSPVGTTMRNLALSPVVAVANDDTTANTNAIANTHDEGKFIAESESQRRADAFSELKIQVEHLTLLLIQAESEKAQLQLSMHMQGSSSNHGVSELASNLSTSPLSASASAGHNNSEQLLDLNLAQKQVQYLQEELEQERALRVQIEKQSQNINLEQDEHIQYREQQQANALLQHTEALRSKGAADEARELALHERDVALTSAIELRAQLTDSTLENERLSKELALAHSSTRLAKAALQDAQATNKLLEELETAAAKSAKENTEKEIRILEIQTLLENQTSSTKSVQDECISLRNRLIDEEEKLRNASMALQNMQKEKLLWESLQSQTISLHEQKEAAVSAAANAVQETKKNEEKLLEVRNALLDRQTALIAVSEECKLAQQCASEAKARQAIAEGETKRLNEVISQAKEIASKHVHSAQEKHSECSRIDEELMKLRSKLEKTQVSVNTEETRLKQLCIDAAAELHKLQRELSISSAEHARKELLRINAEKDLVNAQEKSAFKATEASAMLESAEAFAAAAEENVRTTRIEQRGLQRDIAQLEKQRRLLKAEVVELEDALTSERGYRRTNEAEFTRHIASLQVMLSDKQQRWQGLKEEVRVLECAAVEAKVAIEHKNRQMSEAEKFHERRLEELKDALLTAQTQAHTAARTEKASLTAVEVAHAEREHVLVEIRNTERRLSSVRLTFADESSALDECRSQLRTVQMHVHSTQGQLDAAKEARVQEQCRLSALQSQIDTDTKTLDSIVRRTQQLREEEVTLRDLVDTLQRQVTEQCSARDSCLISVTETRQDAEQAKHQLVDMRARRATLEADLRRLDGEVSFSTERAADATARRMTVETTLAHTRETATAAQRDLTQVQRQLLESRREYDDLLATAADARAERERSSAKLELTSISLVEASAAVRDCKAEKREVLASIRTLREELLVLQGQNSTASSQLELSKSQNIALEATRIALGEDIALLRDSIRAEQARLITTQDSQVQMEASLRSLRSEYDSYNKKVDEVKSNVHIEEQSLLERRRALQNTTAQLLQAERDLRESVAAIQTERVRALEEIGQLDFARQSAQQRVDSAKEASRKAGKEISSQGDRPSRQQLSELTNSTNTNRTPLFTNSNGKENIDCVSHAHNISNDDSVSLKTHSIKRENHNEHEKEEKGMELGRDRMRVRVSEEEYDMNDVTQPQHIPAPTHASAHDHAHAPAPLDELQISAETLRRQSMAVFSGHGIIWNE